MENGGVRAFFSFFFFFVVFGGGGGDVVILKSAKLSTERYYYVYQYCATYCRAWGHQGYWDSVYH